MTNFAPLDNYLVLRAFFFLIFCRSDLAVESRKTCIYSKERLKLCILVDHSARPSTNLKLFESFFCAGARQRCEIRNIVIEIVGPKSILDESNKLFMNFMAIKRQF